jgi:ADP-heptose:LPS heptosyltransferase
VKSLASSAALFIGNDSGPAHIAAAFGRPVIALWGSSDLDNWRPWRTENVVLASLNGIQSIEVSEVADAIGTLARQPV